MTFENAASGEDTMLPSLAVVKKGVKYDVSPEDIV
jgi:hypothetical protein